MSIGSCSIEPPRSTASAAVASASSTANETPQKAGTPSGMPGGGLIRPRDAALAERQDHVLAAAEVLRLGAQAEDHARRTPRRPRGRGVISVFQARLTGSLTSCAPVWLAGLPGAERAGAGWEKNAHPPGVHDVHRLQNDVAAELAHALGERVDVVGREVGRPHRRLALAP